MNSIGDLNAALRRYVISQEGEAGEDWPTLGLAIINLYRKGDLTRSLQLIDHAVSKGFDFDQVVDDGLPLLHLACSENQLEVVAKLIELRLCNLNLISYLGWAPLHIASCINSPQIAHLLLQNGAQINCQTSDDHLFTPLHWACQEGALEAAHLLIHNPNIDLDAPDANGYSALHLASLYGHVAIVKALLEKGAKVNWRSNDGDTPLHLACKAAAEEIAWLLIEHPDIDLDVKDAAGLTSIEIAFETEAFSIVERLLQKEREGSKQFFTLLCFAAKLKKPLPSIFAPFLQAKIEKERILFACLTDSQIAYRLSLDFPDILKGYLQEEGITGLTRQAQLNALPLLQPTLIQETVEAISNEERHLILESPVGTAQNRFIAAVNWLQRVWQLWLENLAWLILHDPELRFVLENPFLAFQSNLLSKEELNQISGNLIHQLQEPPSRSLEAIVDEFNGYLLEMPTAITPPILAAAFVNRIELKTLLLILFEELSFEQQAVVVPLISPMAFVRLVDCYPHVLKLGRLEQKLTFIERGELNFRLNKEAAIAQLLQKILKVFSAKNTLSFSFKEGALQIVKELAPFCSQLEALFSEALFLEDNSPNIAQPSPALFDRSLLLKARGLFKFAFAPIIGHLTRSVKDSNWRKTGKILAPEKGPLSLKRGETLEKILEKMVVATSKIQHRLNLAQQKVERQRQQILTGEVSEELTALVEAKRRENETKMQSLVHLLFEVSGHLLSLQDALQNALQTSLPTLLEINEGGDIQLAAGGPYLLKDPLTAEEMLHPYQYRTASGHLYLLDKTTIERLKNGGDFFICPFTREKIFFSQPFSA